MSADWWQQKQLEEQEFTETQETEKENVHRNPDSRRPWHRQDHQPAPLERSRHAADSSDPQATAF
jgi:hypothetical protein